MFVRIYEVTSGTRTILTSVSAHMPQFIALCRPVEPFKRSKKSEMYVWQKRYDFLAFVNVRMLKSFCLPDRVRFQSGG